MHAKIKYIVFIKCNLHKVASWLAVRAVPAASSSVDRMVVVEGYMLEVVVDNLEAVVDNSEVVVDSSEAVVDRKQVVVERMVVEWMWST